MLKEKSIFVVGASGGIGAQVAIQCAQNGAKVILGYHSNEEKVKKVQEKTPQAQLQQIDISSSESIEKAFEAILTNHQKLYGLVNCTGIHVPGPLISVSPEKIITQIQTNLTGAIILTRQALRHMIRNRDGSIIHLGSVSAHRMLRGHSAYSATKAGLEGFTRAIAAEIAKRKIRVNCIVPGPVMTPMLQESIEKTGDKPEERVPMQRVITTEEVANLACFLLSEKASAITGTSIPVDGGYLLW